MKQYYIHLGQQEGPFTIEQLRSKNLSKETPVWYEGLDSWSTIGEVPELRFIVKATPPPFQPMAKATPPPLHTVPVQSEYEYQMAMEDLFPEKKRIAWGTIALVAFIVLALTFLIRAMNSQ